MKTIYRKNLSKLLVISVPIILSNIISQLQTIIDRIFLGRLDDMYMSAIGNSTSTMWTTMSFCFSVVMGASILISQAVGSGDEEHIEEYAGALIKWNNVIPTILFFIWFFGSEGIFRIMGVSDKLMPLCLAYTKYYAPIFLIVGFGASFSVIFQTSGNTKPLVAYGIIRSGLNVILDWIMIFGHFGCPAMGIKGAAIATTIAEYAGSIYALAIYIRSKDLKTKPSFGSVLKARLGSYIKGFGLGLNTALEDFAWNFGNLMLIRLLNTINDKAAGIYTTVFSIEVFAVVVIGGIGNGTVTLSGEARGRNDKEGFKATAIIAYTISAVTSFVVLLLCIFIPDKIVSLFTQDSTVIASSSVYMLIMGCNLFGKAMNIIIGNGIRGYGDTRWMFVTQIFGTCFVIGLACIFVLVLNWGIVGVFVAVLSDEFVRAVINATKYVTLLKKWKPLNT